VNRNWTGSSGVVNYRLDLTNEEHQVVERFDLGRTAVPAGRGSATLGDLISGVTYEDNSTSMLLYRDNGLFEKCDEIWTLLDYCRSFEEEAVIQYPREDRSMEVRVRNDR
jgi:hypothetical protein